MRARVKKEKLVRIIRRKFVDYSDDKIYKIIDEYGAAYFNKYSDFNIAYIGFGDYEITL